MGKEELKGIKKFFSKIGFVYLLGAIIVTVMQVLIYSICTVVCPNLVSEFNGQFVAMMLPMYLIGYPVFYLLVKKIPLDPDVKIEKQKMPFKKLLAYFTMCYAAMYISNYIGGIISGIIASMKGSEVANMAVAVIESSNIWVQAIFLVILAPICEELFFRKFLIDRVSKYGEGIAVIFSATLFALFHANFSQGIYVFSLGLLFGIIYVKTRNVKYSMICHILINFFGSIAGSTMLKVGHFDEYYSAALSGDPAQIMAYVQNNAGGFLAMALYFVFIFVLVIIGVINIIRSFVKKEFTVSEAPMRLPKGKGFSTVVFNPGVLIFVIVFLAICVGMLFM